jgi:hypothetical protein
MSFKWNGPVINTMMMKPRMFRKYDMLTRFLQRSFHVLTKIKIFKLFKLNDMDYKSWARGLKSTWVMLQILKYPDINFFGDIICNNTIPKNIKIPLSHNPKLLICHQNMQVISHQVEKIWYLYSISKNTTHLL